jgi:hypothetical protein
MWSSRVVVPSLGYPEGAALGLVGTEEVARLAPNIMLPRPLPMVSIYRG